MINILYTLPLLLLLVPKSKSTSKHASKSTLQVIKTLHPKIRKDALRFYSICRKKGINIRIYSGYRSFAEQKKLYAKGRTAPGNVVTNARPGQSYHNYGLAFDCCIIEKNGKCNFALNKTVVAIAKKLGFQWGGDWKSKDTPHFQKTFGYSYNKLLELYKKHKTKYLPL